MSLRLARRIPKTRRNLLVMLVLGIFMALQIATMVHSAQHLFHSHWHFNHHTCPVYEYCDQLVLQDAPPLTLPLLPPLLAVSPPPFAPSFQVVSIVTAAPARAPPFVVHAV